MRLLYVCLIPNFGTLNIRPDLSQQNTGREPLGTEEPLRKGCVHPLKFNNSILKNHALAKTYLQLHIFGIIFSDRYIYIYIYIIYIYRYRYIYIYRYMYIYMYILYIYIDTDIYLYIDTCIYICIYYIDTFIYIDTDIYIYRYMYIYMYILYRYIYIYKWETTTQTTNCWLSAITFRGCIFFFGGFLG